MKKIITAHVLGVRCGRLMPVEDGAALGDLGVKDGEVRALGVEEGAAWAGLDLEGRLRAYGGHHRRRWLWQWRIRRLVAFPVDPLRLGGVRIWVLRRRRTGRRQGRRQGREKRSEIDDLEKNNADSFMMCTQFQPAVL